MSGRKLTKRAIRSSSEPTASVLPIGEEMPEREGSGQYSLGSFSPNLETSMGRLRSKGLKGLLCSRGRTSAIRCVHSVSGSSTTEVLCCAALAVCRAGGMNEEDGAPRGKQVLSTSKFRS